MDKVICSIYKSPRKDEMYIYIEKMKGLKDLPEALLKEFGKPQHVMDMLLSIDGKPLARAENARVLQMIEEQGFYLQMPPPKEDYLLELDTLLSFQDQHDKPANNP